MAAGVVVLPPVILSEAKDPPQGTRVALLALTLALTAGCGARTELEVPSVDASITTPDAPTTLDTGVTPPDAVSPEDTGADVGPPGPCAGCAGCCTAAGVCEPGNTEAACGVGGRFCQACSSGDVCDTENVNGPICVNPCSNRCALRCCMRGGICTSGLENTACGNDNSLCHDCTATGEVCVLSDAGGGVCQP